MNDRTRREGIALLLCIIVGAVIAGFWGAVLGLGVWYVVTPN